MPLRNDQIHSAASEWIKRRGILSVKQSMLLAGYSHEEVRCMYSCLKFEICFDCHMKLLHFCPIVYIIYWNNRSLLLGFKQKKSKLDEDGHQANGHESIWQECWSESNRFWLWGEDGDKNVRSCHFRGRTQVGRCCSPISWCRWNPHCGNDFKQVLQSWSIGTAHYLFAIIFHSTIKIFFF